MEWVRMSSCLIHTCEVFHPPLGQLEFRHKIDSALMLYPGYEPLPQQDVRLLHYGLPFAVGEWQFSKAEHNPDRIVNECNKLFPPPPFPADVRRGALEGWRQLND